MNKVNKIAYVPIRIVIFRVRLWAEINQLPFRLHEHPY